MYLVIAYHGNGRNEVENDLTLLWDNIRRFTGSKPMRHVYCFQAVKDKEGADLLMIVQYDGAAPVKRRVDYWFYVRNRNTKTV